MSGLAPAASSAFTISRLSRCTAQCTAVDPSAPVPLGSAPPLSSVRTAARSPLFAASTSAGPPAAESDTQMHRNPNAIEMTRRMALRLCGPDGLPVIEQQLAGAVSQLRDRHADVIEQRHEQVGHRRIRRVVEVV